MIDFLSDRMLGVYNLCLGLDSYNPLNRVIDVGSDHGKLSAYFLQNNTASYVVCTDIHKNPVMRSDEFLKSYNLSGKYEVHCTDGVCGVPLKAGDTVVIAGMGGNMIMSIIEDCLRDNPIEVIKDVNFVFQPQKTNEELRVFLCSKGFSILEENTFVDRDIFYYAMAVRFTGIASELTLKEKYLGPKLLDKFSSGDELTKAYYKHLLGIFEYRKRSVKEIEQLLSELEKDDSFALL